MKDYNVQIKVRNAPLLRAMRAAGLETAAKLARASGVSNTVIGKYLSLSAAPLSRETGEFLGTVERIAAALNVMPHKLFPAQHLDTPLQTNTGEVELALEEVAGLLSGGDDPHLLLTDQQQRDHLDAAIDELSSREAEVLRRRFGITGEPETCEEIARTFCLSGGRIAQIEHRALRRLRHIMRAA